MKIILATRNPSKVDQIKAFFNDLVDIEINTMEEIGIEGEAIEDGGTLEENAIKKATFVNKKINGEYWSMADDTGLYINALNGEPGIKAARWAGETASTEEITNYTLEKLKDSIDRSAYFKTAAVLISPEGKEYIFTGDVFGKLLDSPRGEPQPKMPYSCIFIPDGHDKVWAEMETNEENAISHRGKAFIQVVEFLNNYSR